jgi:hypothetical protein
VIRNRWAKKNPFLSMWLSGANAVFGATRNQVTKAMHREANAAIAEGTKQVLAFWGIGTPTRKRPARRRRR